ncbi:MAG: sortase [Anaerolineae bacterium]
MSTRRWKSAAILTWGGAAVLLLGLVIGWSRFRPYVETLAYSQRIPTAPPLNAPSGEATPTILMPFESEVDVLTSATPTPTPQAAAPPTSTATVEAPANDATSTPTAEPTPMPTPTPAWEGVAPRALTIPDISLEAPVEAIGWKSVNIGGQTQLMWDVPDGRTAGWHKTSARLGVEGNTVLNGHNTGNGEVFRDLYRLESGAEIRVEGEDGVVYTYQVEEKYILREAGQSVSVRQENARYIQETLDERLTLVTCHPYGSLANRLIVIAYPAQDSGRDAIWR